MPLEYGQLTKFVQSSKLFKMDSKFLNKEIKRLFKEFNSLMLPGIYDSDKADRIGKELTELIRPIGAINALSKNNIIYLVRMQSYLKFMSEARFYLAFVKASDELCELNNIRLS